jgi:hypothetical protein
MNRICFEVGKRNINLLRFFFAYFKAILFCHVSMFKVYPMCHLWLFDAYILFYSAPCGFFAIFYTPSVSYIFTPSVSNFLNIFTSIAPPQYQHFELPQSPSNTPFIGLLLHSILRHRFSRKRLKVNGFHKLVLAQNLTVFTEGGVYRVGISFLVNLG